MSKYKAFLFLALLLSFPSLASGKGNERPLSHQSFIKNQLKQGIYTQEEALLYNYMAIKKPEKLPAELAFLPNEKRLSATGIFVEIFQGLKQKRFSPAVEAFFLEESNGRPVSAGYVDSSKYPLRVHWTDARFADMGRDALEYAEYAWEVETGLGFNAPRTDDGAGGNESIDIYIGSDADGAAGYTKPVEW